MANTHTRNSVDWGKVHEIEDAQATLAGIEILRQRIEHGALFETNYDELYRLACEMMPELRRLKLYLKRVHDIQEELARKGIIKND